MGAVSLIHSSVNLVLASLDRLLPLLIHLLHVSRYKLLTFVDQVADLLYVVK